MQEDEQQRGDSPDITALHTAHNSQVRGDYLNFWTLIFLSQGMFNLHFSEFKVQTGLVWFSSAGKTQITEVWVEGGDGWTYCRF